MTLGERSALLVRLCLFIFSTTHHKNALHQIMKMECNVIKIQGAIKGLKWAKGDLEDLDY